MERITKRLSIPIGEPFFQTTMYEEKVPDKLLAAILVFPALRFFIEMACFFSESLYIILEIHDPASATKLSSKLY